MKIFWIRGNETIRFNRPHTFFVKGVRGAGKSAFLEHVAACYLNEGHTLLDLFGSRDGEGLAWLRSPYAKEKNCPLPCLILGTRYEAVFLEDSSVPRLIGLSII